MKPPSVYMFLILRIYQCC